MFFIGYFKMGKDTLSWVYVMSMPNPSLAYFGFVNGFRCLEAIGFRIATFRELLTVTEQKQCERLASTTLSA